MQDPSKSYISIILAEKILDIFDTSGASEIERLAALDICRSVVPLAPGSIYSKTQGVEAPVEQALGSGD
jgi:hypothetical protein